ncbi:phage tailspike protein [Serratia marcescens]
MADTIIPNVVVSMPSQLFTLARSFKAAANGRIYIGKIDTDPTIPENQIQVYLENEDGTHVPIAQPIIINSGGYPVYGGQIAKFVTVQGHSMAVYDAFGVQQFYFPNVLKYDPDQFKQIIEGKNGLDAIGRYESMAELRSFSPLRAGQRVFLAQYYADRKNLGGGIFVSVADTTTAEDGGFTNIRVNPAYILQRDTKNDEVHILDGGGNPTAGFDNAPVFQRYFDKVLGRPLKLTRGVFECKTGIIIPANKAHSVIFDGAMEGDCILQFSFTPGDLSTSAIKLNGSVANYTYSGLNMRGFKVIGDGSVTASGGARHGLEIRYLAYPQFRNLQVAGFKGSGLLLDRVQDGFFDNINIQRCGHSTGDYTVLADVTDNNKTDYAPLEIMSTQSGDESNMLRFEGLQIENNNCCPYVRVRGGIGHRFRNIHSEHRVGIMASGKNGTWLQMRTADISTYDIQASQFEWAFETNGYGSLAATNWGRSGGIRNVTSGTLVRWRLSNSNFDKAIMGTGVRVDAINCSFGDVVWNFQSHLSSFTSCQFGNWTGDSPEGGAGRGVSFVNCDFASFNANSNNFLFTGGRTSGNFTYRPLSGVGQIIHHDIGGTSDIRASFGLTYIPGPTQHKIIYANTAAPVTDFGNIPYGSIWHNMAASANGDVVEWIRVNRGTGWAVLSKIQS